MLRDTLAMRQAVLLLLPLLFAPSASTQPRLPSSINSNVHIVDGKVLFCQADGTLTILDHATGNVLLSDDRGGCRGTFGGSGAAIALVSGQAAAIDLPATLAQKRLVWLWQPMILDPIDAHGVRSITFSGTCAYFAIASDSVLCNPNGQVVERMLLRDGKTAWRFSAPAPVLELAEHRGLVLVATGHDVIDGLTLLNLQTGKTLANYRVSRRGGERLLVKSFEGDRVVFTAGKTKSCAGELTRTFLLNNTTETLSNTVACSPQFRSVECGSGGLCTFEYPLELSNGTASVSFRRAADTVTVETKLWSTKLNANHLRVELSNDSLFLVQAFGSEATLERVDVRTGQSMWMYVFPTTSVRPWKPGPSIRDVAKRTAKPKRLIVDTRASH